jgi:pantothenate kinase
MLFHSLVHNLVLITLSALHSKDSMFTVYDRLADRLATKVDELQRLPSPSQYWIAVAGGAGSGKTTGAEAVAERLNKYKKECCVVVPADGFHYSQMELTRLHGPDAMLRRGAPFTFDAEGLVDALTIAKKEGQASLPGYSREISDPVSHKIKIQRHHCIVLVEGLYLLHYKDPRWAPLSELWDEQWFVRAPSREIQRQRLVKRSLKTWSSLKAQQWGLGEAGATKRVDNNDVPNMGLIEYCEENANVVIVTQ